MYEAILMQAHIHNRINTRNNFNPVKGINVQLYYECLKD